MSEHYTQTPNTAYDDILPTLGLAETRVFNCIVRRTIGFHRQSDCITLSQFEISTKLTKKSVIEGISKLVEKGLITKTKYPGIRTPEYSTTPPLHSHLAEVEDTTPSLHSHYTLEVAEGVDTTPLKLKGLPHSQPPHKTPRASEKEIERKEEPPLPPRDGGADAAAGGGIISLSDAAAGADAAAGPSPDLMDAGIENWIRDYAADRYCKASFKTKHRSFLESIDSRKTRIRIAEIIDEAQAGGDKSNLPKKILKEFKWNPRKTYEPRAEKSTPARHSQSPSPPRAPAATQRSTVPQQRAVGAESAFSDYSDDDNGWARLWREAKAEIDGEREPDRDPKMEAMRLEIGIGYDEQCPDAVEAVVVNWRQNGITEMEIPIMTWKEFERVFTQLHDSCIPGRKDAEGKRRFKLAVKTYWEEMRRLPQKPVLWAVKEYILRQGDKPFFPQLGTIMEIVDEPHKGEIYKPEPGPTPEEQADFDVWTRENAKRFEEEHGITSDHGKNKNGTAPR